MFDQFDLNTAAGVLVIRGEGADEHEAWICGCGHEAPVERLGTIGGDELDTLGAMVRDKYGCAHAHCPNCSAKIAVTREDRR